MTHNKRWAILALVLSLLAPVLPAVAGDADWKLIEEHWYALEIAGAKAGWMNGSVFSDGERYRTVTDLHMSIGRGRVSVEVEQKMIWVETVDGQPVAMRFIQKMAQQPVESEWLFEGDTVIQTDRQGGRDMIRELPRPLRAAWLAASSAFALAMVAVLECLLINPCRYFPDYFSQAHKTIAPSLSKSEIA